jgi:hypothetical protein
MTRRELFTLLGGAAVLLPEDGSALN